MKALADQSRSNAKVTLIGINPLGASLVQTMPIWQGGSGSCASTASTTGSAAR